MTSLYVGLALIALGATACSGKGATPKSVAKSGTPTATQNLAGAVRKPPPVVSDVVLPDVSPAGGGAPFALRARPSQLLLVYFGYTGCPDVCPTTFSMLKSALRDLGPDASRVDVAMVTVDPKRDTPEALSTYLAHFFSNYHALRTDNRELLESAEKPFGVKAEIEGDPASGSYGVSHTATVFVLDDTGRVVLEWPFGGQSSQVTGDLRILLDKANKQGEDH